MKKSHWRVLAVLLCIAAMTGCLFGSDDGDDGDDQPTVPVVVSVSPADDAVNVAPDAEILVTFNVAMDAPSVTAATTLSDLTRGSVAFEAVWVTSKLLRIDPDEQLTVGMVYTLSIGTSAQSEAGEPLAAVFASSFTTIPDHPVVLSTYPANGATGVPRNATVIVEFSTMMDMASTYAAFGIAPYVTPDIDFNGLVIEVQFTDGLAASTTYTVTIDGSAAAEGPGETMGDDYVFSFTTGAAEDNTPPSIVSYSPANGATGVSPDIGEIVITFSEPITDSVEPLAIDLRLNALLYADPTLSPDGTQLTVPLLRLPTGCTLWADLGPFADLAGNWSSDPPVYSFSTSGSADFFPADVGDWWEYFRDEGENEDWYLMKAENVGGGDFDLTRWREESPPPGRQPDEYTVLDEISHYSRTSQTLYWDGRNEKHGDNWFAYDFTPPIEWMNFPLNLGRDWAGQAEFTLEEGDVRVVYSVEVTDTDVDYAPPPGRSPQSGRWALAGDRQGSYVFPDCTELTLSYQMYRLTVGDPELVEEGEETDLYCPGLGLVQKEALGIRYGEGDPQVWTEDTGLRWWLVGQ